MNKLVRTVFLSAIIFTLLITACNLETDPGSATPTSPGGGIGTLPGDIVFVGTPLDIGPGVVALPSLQVFIGTLPFTDIGTLPPSATPTPWFHVIIVRDLLCYLGPGPDWSVVGSIPKGTLVPVIARGSTQGWLVISYFSLPCWLKLDSVDTGDNNPDDLPPVDPGPRNTKTPTVTEKPEQLGCFVNGKCLFPCPPDYSGPACTP